MYPAYRCLLFILISNEALLKCKQRIELIANTLELEGFSRIDAFVNADSGEVCCILDFFGYFPLPSEADIDS